jgi:dTDP-4-amino-4,6-dideoxygalactose transaminase
MNFIDLASQQDAIRELLDQNIASVLKHGKYIMGPEVADLEKRLAAFVNVQHAVSCSSGTDALLMALMSYGVGPGDAVFTTPFTFVATAEAICLLGATPVFVDVDRRTYNIDPSRLKAAIKAVQEPDASIYPLPFKDSTKRLEPKGIVAVDLFGLPADYDSIGQIAKEHDLFVIGDAAQSLGSEYKGQMAASIPDITCTSFFPAKPLGCYGDGGMCFTNDTGQAEALRSIRLHGKGSQKYDNVRIGINGRLDTLQAAILLAKMEIFSKEIEMRQQVASRYTQLLNGQKFITPFTPDGYKSVWAQYSILAHTRQERQDHMAYLKRHKIPSAIYYPKPLHLQTAFNHLGYKKGTFGISESLSERIFSLPMHPYLSEEDQLKVVRSLCKSTQ